MRRRRRLRPREPHRARPLGASRSSPFDTLAPTNSFRLLQHLVTSMAQYMLAAPIYINLLNIYSFSNLHDFSWCVLFSHAPALRQPQPRAVVSNETLAAPH